MITDSNERGLSNLAVFYLGQARWDSDLEMQNFTGFYDLEKKLRFSYSIQKSKKSGDKFTVRISSMAPGVNAIVFLPMFAYDIETRNNKIEEITSAIREKKLATLFGLLTNDQKEKAKSP